MARRTLTLAFVVVLIGTIAQPCAFHSYTPQPTIVDRMLGSDDIVLARPAADNPFKFEALKALEGNAGLVEIPHLVDSVTRRRLAADPEAHVLFARDGDYGPWLRLAYVDADMAPVLQGILTRLPSWELGSYLDRFNFFAALTEHPDGRIRNLALQELDRADYAVLRSLELAPDIDRVTGRLNLLSELHLRPIRILLMGLSKEPEVEPMLEAGLRANAQVTGPELGAYATAFIEHIGPVAAQTLAKDYLANAGPNQNGHEMMVEALAIHSADGNPEMRRSIQLAVRNAVQKNPKIAPMVARQFGARNDWSQTGPLSELLKTEGLTLLTDVIVVSQYVALAAQAQEIESN